MGESSLLEVVDSIELEGEAIPESMIDAMLPGSGNDLDAKCCHCISPYSLKTRDIDRAYES